MANWQRTLDVKDVWESDDISLIAKTAADKLRQLAPFSEKSVEEERLFLADKLELLSKDTDITPYDFDLIWREVYDWGDTSMDSNWNGKKVCWIKTF